jgi:hypothetical protein
MARLATDYEIKIMGDVLPISEDTVILLGMTGNTDQEERQRVVSNFEKYFPNVKILVYNKDRIEVKVAINHTESDPA